MSRIISKEAAGEIALNEALTKLPNGDCRGEAAEVWEVTDRPARFNPDYNEPVGQPAWYVFLPWFDGVWGLRSSRVIVVSKVDGRILYDGSAGDEG